MGASSGAGGTRGGVGTGIAGDSGAGAGLGEGAATGAAAAGDGEGWGDEAAASAAGAAPASKARAVCCECHALWQSVCRPCLAIPRPQGRTCRQRHEAVRDVDDPVCCLDVWQDNARTPDDGLACGAAGEQGTWEKGCTLAVLPHQAQHPTKASLLNSCVSLSANNRTAAQTIPPDCALTGSCWPSAAVTLPADARSEVVSRWGTMEASTKPRRKVGSCRQGEEQLSLPNATASAIGSAANLEHSLNCPAVICMQLILINNWRTPLTVSTHLQLVAGHCAAEHSSVERLVAGRKDCGAAGQGQAGVECTCTLRPARVAPKGTALCRT